MRRWAWLAFGATLLLAVGAQAQTLERVRASGTFKIGFREDAEPFSFKDREAIIGTDDWLERDARYAA